jgi:ribosomal protein S18 acetylase RimI-like enzyme
MSSFIQPKRQTQHYRLVLRESQDDALRTYVRSVLQEHNAHHAVSSPNPQPISISVVDAHGRAVGGLIAQTYWNWLSIDLLAIAEEARGLGLGTQMMAQAELEAKRRGCAFARTSTYAFQALRFYERLGYHIIGQIDDYPEGATLYWLRKAL